MRIQIGIENEPSGRAIAWVLGHLGCFAYGSSAEIALAAVPQAVSDYAVWIASRNHGQTWVETGEIELFLAETWDDYIIDTDFEPAQDGYEVGAWFRHDWKPLTELEIARAQQLLAWGRADLLDAVAGLSPEALNAQPPGERWNMLGILRHVGGAEWWYLDRLGLAFPQQELPKDSFERIEKVRSCLLEALSGLAGSRKVVGMEGEFWSPRKLLRRAIWHERDHTVHLHKLRGAA